MISASAPVSLLEIGARTATGYSSGAYRCLGEDGRYYFVKSPRLAGAKAVISEWLAAGLAEAMELPVQEAVVVEIPTVLVAPEIRELGQGLAFGSLELAHADDLSFSTASKLPASCQRPSVRSCFCSTIGFKMPTASSVQQEGIRISSSPRGIRWRSSIMGTPSTSISTRPPSVTIMPLPTDVSSGWTPAGGRAGRQKPVLL